ncbi:MULTISPECIES: DUF3185 family protein [unclassified Pseudoalteromonas]|jgi:uncharacterized membrane protein YidH (DUF202 family)|uniref:DUF3185 family protein n=1 Tax=unclassified Pseudoalteromonas TaxID=194690 RepID=UPI0004164236|nr:MULTISPECIES: DUF3185 family protein [unclassified Pseudoalteromonas]TMP48891.1 DUF3185 domain-containing protein [Pseudoalteromonas sp. S1688]TMS92151.1 DUF3185 domain-containing protein [Pseudoalteromonas sp. S201]
MTNKIIGIVLIVIGIALAIWGYDVYDSATSQVTRALNGETPMEAWLGFIGAAVCILVGITRLK